MPSALGTVEINEFLHSELSLILNRELPEFTDDTRLLGELGLDSTGVVELLMALEDSLGLRVDPDELTAEVFATIGALRAYIMAGLAAAPGDAD
jgi:acyl carrier protein